MIMSDSDHFAESAHFSQSGHAAKSLLHQIREHVIDKDAVVLSKTMAWYFDRAHIATSKVAGEKQRGS